MVWHGGFVVAVGAMEGSAEFLQDGCFAVPVVIVDEDVPHLRFVDLLRQDCSYLRDHF
jgi:hypothetical protein